MARGGGAGIVPSGSPDRARLVTLAAATIGLVTLVAVMSDGSLLHAGRTSDRLGRDLTIGIGVAFAIGASISVVFVLFALAGGHRVARRKPSIWRTFVATAIVLTIIAFAAHFLPKNTKPSPRQATPTTAPTLVSECPPNCTSKPAHPGASPWWLAIAVGAFAVSALVVGGRRRGGSDAAEASVERAAEERARSLFDASLDDLENEPDPRRAIVAAYSRLLDGLAGCGLARAPAETPAEHLHRSLASLSVEPTALRQLTELFAEARFSSHVLTQEHKRLAIDAFRAARDSLRPLQLTELDAP
jgi:hypothetical protein